MKKLLLLSVLLLSAFGLKARKYNSVTAEAVSKRARSADLSIKIAALEDILATDLDAESVGVIGKLGETLTSADETSVSNMLNFSDIKLFLRNRLSSYLEQARIEQARNLGLDLDDNSDE